MPGIAGPSGKYLNYVQFKLIFYIAFITGVHSTIADRGDVGRPQFEAMPRPIPPTFVPLIVHTTEAPTTSKPDLFTTLPWLKNILNDNGYLTLPAGIDIIILVCCNPISFCSPFRKVQIGIE